MKQTFVIVFVALLALTSGLAIHIFNKPAEIQTISLADITLPDLKGQQQPLSNWQDKFLIINFWATWCPPCLKEIPDFITMQNDYADQNIQFIGIALEEQQTVAEYAAAVSINYPILIGEYAGAQLARSWGNTINAVPFTVILNQHGQIIHRQMGEITQAQILDVIEPLFNKN
ncbi:MAG: TlpA disulfide reductase family protein [Methylococcales bacterium]|nr:TlpA disulfide reductase family protein [Methylococcales bacterium]